MRKIEAEELIDRIQGSLLNIEDIPYIINDLYDNGWEVYKPVPDVKLVQRRGNVEAEIYDDIETYIGYEQAQRLLEDQAVRSIEISTGFVKNVWSRYD